MKNNVIIKQDPIIATIVDPVMQPRRFPREDSSSAGSSAGSEPYPKNIAANIRHRILFGFTATFVLLAGIFSASLIIFQPFQILQTVQTVWIIAISLAAWALGYWITLRLVTRELQKFQQERTSQMAKNGELLDYILNLFHVLGSPLAVVFGYGELLADQELRSKESFLDTCHEVITKEIGQISRGIENAASLIYLETSGYAMKMSALRLAPLIAEVVEQTGKKARQKATFTNLAGELVIRGDIIWMKEAFTYVLANILADTSSPVEVILSLEQEQNSVKISLRTGKTDLAISNKNSFSQEFESFKSITKSDGGSNLGYYLANQIILRHGGRILADSQPNQDFKLNIVLPINHSKSKQ